MFRSYCFCSYSNTAYKSPHFPFLTFPILLVPYFVPPSNLLGTFYIKVNRLENLIKVDTGITTDYTTLGSYTYNFPKSYKKVLGVAINVYKTGTATTLENVYLTGFNNTSFSFVKDCVESPKANTVKIAYTVFYI